MKSFYVIIQDFNAKKFEPYDVIPYFVREYNEAKNKPKTYDEFREFVKKKSMYMYWSRCEYELILCGWPNTDTQEKWDIHKQLMMNIELVTKVLMDNIKS